MSPGVPRSQASSARRAETRDRRPASTAAAVNLPGQPCARTRLPGRGCARTACRRCGRPCCALSSPRLASCTAMLPLSMPARQVKDFALAAGQRGQGRHGRRAVGVAREERAELVDHVGRTRARPSIACNCSRPAERSAPGHRRRDQAQPLRRASRAAPAMQDEATGQATRGKQRRHIGLASRHDHARCEARRRRNAVQLVQLGQLRGRCIAGTSAWTAAAGKPGLSSPQPSSTSLTNARNRSRLIGARFGASQRAARDRRRQHEMADALRDGARHRRWP